MSKTTHTNMDDRQAEVADVMNTVEEVNEHLTNAESSELPEDFDANLDEAEDALKRALSELKELRKL
jgi:N-methylhydantoinase B/oxoprolinase/acetone carboxylase alpha subunit